MKILKTILGILLTYGIGKEFVRVGKEYYNFFVPGIIICTLIFLLGCTWLIGSGISKNKLKFRSLIFVKYFAGTLSIFILFVFLCLTTFKYEPDIVKLNGINVNIAEFMHGSKNIFPDKTERREYCICVANKLTSDREFARKHKAEFESGDFANVINDLQISSSSNNLNLLECMNYVRKMNWTPEFEKGIRSKLMKQFLDNQLYFTNDTGKLCNCLIEQYKLVPMNELNSTEFMSSQKKMKIDSICYVNSLLYP